MRCKACGKRRAYMIYRLVESGAEEALCEVCVEEIPGYPPEPICAIAV